MGFVVQILICMSRLSINKKFDVTTSVSRKDHGKDRPRSGQELCHRLGEAKIIGTEQDRFTCWIKETIAIRKKGGTTMNREENIFFLTFLMRF